MEHEWILDVSIYYEATKYEDIIDIKCYNCKMCQIPGFQNPENGEIEPYWLKDKSLTCNEIIIKNILE